MMTDYSALPKYERMTPLDARYNYAFPERMKRHDVCCGWLVGERQEESIAVLEDLIEKRRGNDD